MILAYHVIFGTYGFWLPNDLRGSWSDFVWAWELRRFGPATKTESRRSVAHATHDSFQRAAAKMALKYPAVVLDGLQAASAGKGFAAAATKNGYSVLACSIMPEHVHLVIARHHYNVEQVVRAMKQAATEQLNADARHPLAAYTDRNGGTPTPWARGCWKVFLDDERDVERAIEYVERNPMKEGLKRQCWHCVVPRGGVDLRSTAKQVLVRAKG